jgi:hypothetical protein
MPVILVVAVVGLIAVVGGGGEEDISPENNRVNMGAPLTVGNVEWQVTQAREVD